MMVRRRTGARAALLEILLVLAVWEPAAAQYGSPFGGRYGRLESEGTPPVRLAESLPLEEEQVGRADLPPAPAPSLTDQERLDALEAELKALRSRLGGGSTDGDGAGADSDLDPMKSDAPKESDTKSGKENSGATKDENQAKKKSEKPPSPTVKVTGFFQADAGWFQQDSDSLREFGDIQDVRGFRRARLAATGNVAKNVAYYLEMDFAFPGRPSFMDVWLEVQDLDWVGNVRVGQWRQPFGLDELISVRELTFLERPAMFALGPFRQTGIGFHNTAYDKRMTYAASVYGFPTDPWGDVFGDRGYGMATRVTALPVDCNDGKYLIHVGGDFAAHRPSNHIVQFRNQPEFGGPFVGPLGNTPSVPFFVDTGPLDASGSYLLNAEWAMIAGPFHAQSELRYAIVDRDGPNSTFPAFYAQAAWILTGETRGYNRDAGVLGRVKPKHDFGRCSGCGAWEIAARYSWIDLNEPDLPRAAAGQIPFGGELSTVTLGLNWYLNTYTKFQFDYIRAVLDRPPVGDNTTNIFAVRAQLDF